ncbi:MAG: hypothetical protein WC852_05280 [Candidatus Nanoarchaeia archaeon]|jgi:hypothetical protein
MANKLKAENKKLKGIISVIGSSENVRKLNRAFQDLKEGKYKVR